jgi:hypothetical protein
MLLDTPLAPPAAAPDPEPAAPAAPELSSFPLRVNVPLAKKRQPLVETVTPELTVAFW